MIGHGRLVCGKDCFLYWYYSYVGINRMRAGPGLVDILSRPGFGGLTLIAYEAFLRIYSTNSYAKYLRYKKKRGQYQLQ